MTAAASRKRIWGWMAFDWASQPYYTLLLTFIFGPYFAAVATEAFMASGMTEDAADAQAQSIWGLGQTLAGLVIAFTAPLLGALADSSGRRTPWIAVFSLLYVIGAGALWFMTPDGSSIWQALIFFGIGFIGAEYALIFINAILPSLGDDKEVGRISGSGAAFGYWGGVLSLVIMLTFFVGTESGKPFIDLPKMLGFAQLDSNSIKTLLGFDPLFWGLEERLKEGTRFVGPLSALWFAVFMIPFFLWVKDEPREKRKRIPIRQTLSELVQTLKNIFKRKSLAYYLASSMFYRDALNALYGFGGVYATLVLDWPILAVGIFGIIGAITAAIVTWGSGFADRAFGPKPVIRVCVWVLIFVCAIIVGMSRESLFGVALSEGSSLPDIIFYICGACIGGAGGALYAASRSMMVRHTNPERPTEAFGLFALSGKATAFIGPALITLVTYLTSSARLGVSPLILLFVIGLILLRWVNENGDRNEWFASPPS